MEEITFAIAGCGHIAQKHAQALQTMDGVRLVAVCDPNPGRVQKFARDYEAVGYVDYRDLLEREDIDVINICTPSGLHGEMGLLAARAGKHVLLEKPMALTLTEADRLIRGCREAGVQLGVTHQNRFKPVVRSLKEAVEQGYFGKLTHGNATVRWNRDEAYFQKESWRGTKELDGGVLLNQAIHNIDLLIWIMGPVQSVFAYTATRLRAIETEDVGVAILKFANGALGVIEAATTLYPRNLEETLGIFGENGTVILGGITARTARVWQVRNLPGPGQETVSPVGSFPGSGQETLLQAGSYLGPGQDNLPLPPFHGHREAIKDFVAALRTGNRPLVDGQEARKTLEVILAIYRSAATGQEIKLPLEVESFEG